MADNKSVAAKKSTAKGKKRVKRSVPLGQVHIQATFNNTIITFADNHGNALSASSAGACGFRGQYGLTKVDVYVKGVGLGRDAAIRAISGAEMQIESINDVTGVPHGGVRPKRERRA